MRSTLVVVTVAALSGCGPEWDPIAGEEGAREAVALSAASFAHVIEAGDRFWIVLDQHPDLKWAQGEPVVVARSPLLVASAAAAEAALAREVLAWRGREVRLHDVRAALCTGVVSGFALVGRRHGSDADISDEDGSPLALTREGWELAAPILAAEVRPSAGRCAGASWARATDAREARIAKAGPAPESLARAALAAFRELDTYAEIDRRYQDPELDEHIDRRLPWEHHDGSAPQVVVVEDAATRSTLVVVAASAGAGCGGFSGQLTGIWRLAGGGVELLGELEQELVPDSAADLDGDGVPELLFRSGVLQLAADRASKARQDFLSVPFYGCPC
jgi:hypothetical protein